MGVLNQPRRREVEPGPAAVGTRIGATAAVDVNDGCLPAANIHAHCGARNDVEASLKGQLER